MNRVRGRGAGGDAEAMQPHGHVQCVWRDADSREPNLPGAYRGPIAGSAPV
jgi:hypothetical protein